MNKLHGLKQPLPQRLIDLFKLQTFSVGQAWLTLSVNPDLDEGIFWKDSLPLQDEVRLDISGDICTNAYKNKQNTVLPLSILVDAHMVSGWRS